MSYKPNFSRVSYSSSIPNAITNRGGYRDKEESTTSVSTSSSLTKSTMASSTISTSSSSSSSPPTKTNAPNSETKWKSFPSMYHSRYRFASTTHEGKVYVFGGTAYEAGRYKRLKSAEVYDPGKKEWTFLPDMHITRSGASCVTVKDNIYILGGTTNAEGGRCNSIEVFNVKTNTWSMLKSPMLTKKEQHCSVVVGNKIYVFGGNKSGHTEVYDIDTKEWKKAAVMNVSRNAMASVSVNNRIYAIGGKQFTQYTEGHVPCIYEIIEIYDIAKDEWTISTAKMKNRRRNCSAFATGSTITVIGGIDDTNNDVVYAIEAYNINENKWTGSVIHPPLDKCGFTSVLLGSDLLTIGCGKLMPNNDKRKILPSNKVEVFHGALDLISRAETKKNIVIPLVNETTNISVVTKSKKSKDHPKLHHTCPQQNKLNSKKVEADKHPRLSKRRKLSKTTQFEFQSLQIAKKFFNGIFVGKIISYNEKKSWWKVKYQDGDCEDLNRREIIKGLELYDKKCKNKGRSGHKVDDVNEDMNRVVFEDTNEDTNQVVFEDTNEDVDEDVDEDADEDVDEDVDEDADKDADKDVDKDVDKDANIKEHASEKQNKGCKNNQRTYQVPASKSIIGTSSQDDRMRSIEEILNNRLKKVVELESKAFGGPKSGGLESRIAKLEDFLGISLSM